MDNTNKIRKRYDRIAGYFDLLEKPMGTSGFDKWRKELVNQAKGKTLEVGVGTGKNLRYYSTEMDLTAIDFSKKMLDKAKAKYKDDLPRTSFLEMDVENMDFKDESFDTILTSCVFCSVPNPVKGLEEIKRVLKPNGQLIMLEHVRSGNKMLGTLMDWFNFIPLYIIGDNINRRTDENLKKAGFENIKETRLWSDIVKFFIVKK
ncbi:MULTISPECIES: class I SAM-dependent methyltransferase [Flavobacteriaceae]|jgi:ubiquinone/menaquinone biosynthesis C-methylase UbiE|uniref:class I SAM-dependent methyltransferase n=1 Tax=Flavobacteriaceae TaxID=49546 RepID=UPI000C0A8DA5|nr:MULTISPECIES: class I SAM-dependent methyltransferase [Flavobacteriaceae]MAU16614.1 SAM-dependent methyltransferase [Allomuricauda sp.]MAX71746.1 SAM-dependent methyltransferase [Flavobacteriaceae bacterium]MDC7994126.1 methyltransferase domain-containing protein [Altibacter sp. HG106]MDH7911971.1 methyltransferase domain-containing protein [Winogradskyella sp. SYSU M77433]|tara:strand:- start:1680 stop:2291 length:612 start_codon:yes stop_codon:yes gene_type:complete